MTENTVAVEQCDREAAADLVAITVGGVEHIPDYDPHIQAFARHRIAALASAPAGVNITVRQKTPVVADYGDNFLVAQVSADGKTVGIDHPCDAVWSDVNRAQTALRDYINERIAAQDKCPFKPRSALDREAVERITAAWCGDADVLPLDDAVEVMAVDIEGGNVLARAACWVRWRGRPESAWSYRSCDLTDLVLSDEQFAALTANP